MDYFDIKQTDLISTIGSETILQSVELLGATSPYVSYVKLGPPNSTTAFRTGTPITAAGQIGNSAIDSVYVTDSLTNIAAINLSGVDAKVQYTVNDDQMGRFDASVSVGYYKSYTVQSLPTDDPFQTVGLATNTNGTIPRWNSYSSVSWSRGKLKANVGLQYMPGVDDVNGTGTVRAPFKIASYTSVDVSASYSFGSDYKMLDGMTLRIGSTNVFNRMPPNGGGTFTEANADIATYSPIGRMIFVEGKYKF
jgi:iron complex outermembrane receptor protein